MGGFCYAQKEGSMAGKIDISGQTVENRDIKSGSCFLGNAIVGEALSVDTLKATLDCSQERPTLFAPADAGKMLTCEDEVFGVRPYYTVLVFDPTLYSYGTPVTYYHDDALIGQFFLSSVKRVGKFTYDLDCVSAVGLLDNSTHYGGLYTGQTLQTILADIVGGLMEYTVDAALKTIPVYGWLPVATRRDNLHQLLFATGVSLRKDATGKVWITTLSEAEKAALDNARVFDGGSIDYHTPATSVEISEHAYIAFSGDERVTLYEGEVAAEPLVTPKGSTVSGSLILFDGPMHNIRVDNGSILESGVNYAVLGPSSDCKLTGQAYTHTTRIISRPEPGTRLVQNKDNTVSVTDATLVSLANSENVAERVTAYYTAAKTVKEDIVVGVERPGDAVTYTDPFDEQDSGFIQSMDISMSQVLRAKTEIVSGFHPTPAGNYYQNYRLFTAGTLWTVPASCKGKIRVVIIGGGDGGSGGEQGERGTTAVNGVGYGKSGAGGTAGQGGNGGKINIVTLKATLGQSFTVTVGAGGTGGAGGADRSIHDAPGEGVAPQPGTAGGASTFGSYSSRDGRPSSAGFANQFTGVVYGTPGAAGIAGGPGQGDDGSQPTITYNGVTYRAGAKGNNVQDGSYYGLGGLGGGAAAGANGANGGNGNQQEGINKDFFEGGDGGRGATPVAGKNATQYGAGGAGGHGGGGGGGGGPARSWSTSKEWPGQGGLGGAGSAGGNGKAGCVIVYY